MEDWPLSVETAVSSCLASEPLSRCSSRMKPARSSWLGRSFS